MVRIIAKIWKINYTFSHNYINSSKIKLQLIFNEKYDFIRGNFNTKNKHNSNKIYLIVKLILYYSWIEIIEYAKFLGMDLYEDKDLFWIAREGLKAPLPGPWKPC